MKGLIQVAGVFLLFRLAILQAQAAFTSLYVFGDTVSTTTNGPGGSDYYGNRYSNGRVWVEVLAQRQGVVNYVSTNNNISYYDNDSPDLVTEANNFAPTNALTNALFVIWVIDADFVDILNQSYPVSPPYSTAQLPQWTNVFNQFLSNHFEVITNLYAKGARTFIMPDAVNLTEVPGYAYYLGASDELFFRQRVLDFNAEFSSMLSNAMSPYPGLKIYVPDFSALLDEVLTNSAYYGLTNVLDSSGKSTDAIDFFSPNSPSLTGQGTNFIFWDYLDPTAKLHEIMADTAQQLIAPAQISRITSQSGTNQLTLANVPIGLNGVVLGSTNLALTNWTAVTNFSSTNNVQSIVVPISGPVQFYRLNFPFAWTWP